MPWNILVHGGQWFYIDDEWEYQGLLPIDYVMFRFIINFACTQCEYLSQKNILGTDVANFILRTIQQIYSQYDSHRNEINKHRQDQLDEIVFTSSTDNKIQKLILEKQFLEKRLSDLDILLIYKKEEVEKLLLQEEQAAAERDGQIDDFKQTIAERDGQIDDFKQTIAERDGQIDDLQANHSRAGRADR